MTWVVVTVRVCPEPTVVVFVTSTVRVVQTVLGGCLRCFVTVTVTVRVTVTSVASRAGGLASASLRERGSRDSSQECLMTGRGDS